MHHHDRRMIVHGYCVDWRLFENALYNAVKILPCVGAQFRGRTEVVKWRTRAKELIMSFSFEHVFTVLNTETLLLFPDFLLRLR